MKKQIKETRQQAIYLFIKYFIRLYSKYTRNKTLNICVICAVYNKNNNNNNNNNLLQYCINLAKIKLKKEKNIYSHMIV